MCGAVEPCALGKLVGGRQPWAPKEDHVPSRSAASVNAASSERPPVSKGFTISIALRAFSYRASDERGGRGHGATMEAFVNSSHTAPEERSSESQEANRKGDWDFGRQVQLMVYPPHHNHCG